MQFISDASQILRIASSAKARLSDYEGKDMLFLEIGCHSQYEPVSYTHLDVYKRQV